MTPDLTSILRQMVENCPICKGAGQVKRWVAMENGVPLGRFDGMKPCGYCLAGRKVLGMEP